MRALDWDNVGTVTAIADPTGTAYVHFVAPDGRQATSCLHWAQIKPIDHPDPADLTDEAADYFALAEQAARRRRSRLWHRQLAGHGIDPDEPVVVPAAIEHRHRQLAHRLAGQQPAWLTWWLGARPATPAGTQVWDDEVTALATWRDAHHLDDDVAGYGPPPDDPPHVDRWRRTPPTQPPHPPLAPRPPTRPRPRPRARTHRRRGPSNGSTNSTPSSPRHHPTRPRILDALHTGTPHPADLDAAIAPPSTPKTPDATGSSSTGPTSSNTPNSPASAPPQAPSPTGQPPSPPTQQLYDQLVAISTDTPEQRSLTDLDAELAAADPDNRLHDLEAQLDELDARIRAIRTERSATHDLARIDMLDSTLQTLLSIHKPLRDEASTARAQLHLHRWGAGRPQHLVDAVTRRRSHLAHHAITTREAWVTAVLRAAASQGHTTGALYRLIVEIAAHRERQNVHGPDPLGDPPPDILQAMIDQLEPPRRPEPATARAFAEPRSVDMT